MSLRIKHLNGDTSFLLIFSPVGAPHNPQGTFPGSFTILVDPWLSSSPSKVFSSRFALTHRVTPACLESLAELPDPDLVLVSQDKPDHCHEETLRRLPADTGATILGTPAAAKKIRGWRHFDPVSIRALKRFDERHQDSIYRIPIPAFSPSGIDGEVTVALIVAKVDLTGLHNALAITYRPPSSALSASSQISYINLPPTPPTTPPSLKPIAHCRHFSNPQPSSSRKNLEPTLSVIYAPHGVSYQHLIKPYASTHLLSTSALPLTALFHSFSRTSNPWYLGGNISAGSPGGLKIARALCPKVWISAHDEEKDNSGLSVAGLKTEKYEIEQIRAALDGVNVDATDDYPNGTMVSAGSASTSTSLSSGCSTVSSGTDSIVSRVMSRERHKAKRKGAIETLLLEMESGEEYFIPETR